MDLLIYIAKVNLYWILLYGCYRLMLRNHTFFQWNRFYLLGSLPLAFALPFVIYPETAPALPSLYEVNAAAFTVSSPIENEPIFTWEHAIWIIYGIGLCVAVYLFLKQVFQLRRFLKSGELIELEDCTVVMIDSNKVGSFSFLKWIVINRNDYENHFDSILCHEMVHTRQWHSADIIFCELFKAVFWFNPVLSLYKSALQEVHEFLADSEAANRENYARFLVNYALNAPIASLTNHFFKPSQIKSRIQMIYKNRSSKWMLSTYVAAFTIIGAVALFVAGCEQKESQLSEIVGEKAIKTEKREDFAGKKIFTVVEQQPEFPGGSVAMYKFLGENIKYPEAAIKNNIQGRVFLSFVVTETGEVQNIMVLKGLGYGCDAEAIRVLKKFPKWKPARQDGETVNVKYNLPINFEFDEKRGKLPKGVNVNAYGKKPLFIVDGKEMGTSMPKHITPDRIESVEVFKNEMAVEMYGEKGKDGIVKVTTIK